MKSATLFSGFEGVGVGMRAAGLEHVWGLEIDDQIASVARVNGFNTLTLNILDADPALFERVDVLNASPPCPSFSVAKKNGVETELDIALARKTADFIEVLRPKYFILENVWGYRNSQSWGIISNRLDVCGYWLDLAHVNFADYGVPQTRKRMIVRAVHNGFVPYLPKQEKWIGWYEAIEDLIPTLPASEFAEWQFRSPNFPDYAHTFITDSQNKRYEKHLTVCGKDQPVFTLTADKQPHRFKTFIVSGNNANNFGTGQGTVRTDSEPVFTICASSHKGIARAWLSQGKVVKMTARALARFQSFPDSYILSGKNSLDCKGIGNAVPPLGYQKIIAALIASS